MYRAFFMIALTLSRIVFNSSNFAIVTSLSLVHELIYDLLFALEEMTHGIINFAMQSFVTQNSGKLATSRPSDIFVSHVGCEHLVNEQCRGSLSHCISTLQLAASLRWLHAFFRTPLKLSRQDCSCKVSSSCHRIERTRALSTRSRPSQSRKESGAFRRAWSVAATFSLS